MHVNLTLSVELLLLLLLLLLWREASYAEEKTKRYTEEKTEQHLIVHSGKSEAEVS